jgi:hypothetical protein
MEVRGAASALEESDGCQSGSAERAWGRGLGHPQQHIPQRTGHESRCLIVRLGLPHIADRGSFTLTSGILSQHPTPGSASISLVNAGVESFARAAALELPRGIRINVVSPPWVRETLQAMGRDPHGGPPRVGGCACIRREPGGRDDGRSSQRRGVRTLTARTRSLRTRWPLPQQWVGIRIPTGGPLRSLDSGPVKRSGTKPVGPLDARDACADTERP